MDLKDNWYSFRYHRKAKRAADLLYLYLGVYGTPVVISLPVFADPLFAGGLQSKVNNWTTGAAQLYGTVFNPTSNVCCGRWSCSSGYRVHTGLD